MVCKKCNGENEEYAVFCKFCGTKLSEETPVECEEVEEKEDTFDKEDTSEKEDASEKKQKLIHQVKWICSIVFLAIALLLITLNFASTFSNFIKLDIPAVLASLTGGMEMEANLFSTIDSIKNYVKVDESSISVFYAMSEAGLFVPVIQLIAILVAMIGTFAVLLVGAYKAIYTIVTKKEYIDLKKYVAFSVGFLICGALFVAIFGAKMKISIGISMTVMTQLGGFVGTCIWLSIAFLFLCMIYELIVNAIEKNENTSIFKSIFHIVEVVLLVCLVMIVAGACLHVNTTMSGEITGTMDAYYKNGGWFSVLNETIYNMNQSAPESFEFNTVSGVYILSIISLILCLVLIVVFAVFLTKRACVKDSKYSGSLAVGIVSVCLSFVYMIFAFIVISKLKSNNELMVYLGGTEANKISIGASVVTTFALSILLLTEEIVGKVLVDKKKI